MKIMKTSKTQQRLSHDPKPPSCQTKFRIKSTNTLPVDLHSGLCLYCLHVMVSKFYIAAVKKNGNLYCLYLSDYPPSPTNSAWGTHSLSFSFNTDTGSSGLLLTWCLWKLFVAPSWELKYSCAGTNSVRMFPRKNSSSRRWWVLRLWFGAWKIKKVFVLGCSSAVGNIAKIFINCTKSIQRSLVLALVFYCFIDFFFF